MATDILKKLSKSNRFPTSEIQKNRQDLTSRKDIELIVRLFYPRASFDDCLGPIFEAHIHGESAWEAHFALVSDFWETVIFENPVYRNNPLRKHKSIGMQAVHLDHWLSLFNEVIEENFAGPKAEELKKRASIMKEVFMTKLVK